MEQWETKRRLAELRIGLYEKFSGSHRAEIKIFLRRYNYNYNITVNCQWGSSTKLPTYDTATYTQKMYRRTIHMMMIELYNDSVPGLIIIHIRNYLLNGIIQ